MQSQTKKGQTSICKVRGITLNFKNLIDINFDTINELVTGNRQGQTIPVVNEHKIDRNKTIGQIITRVEKKDYRIVFDKRIVKDTIQTYPYGY